MGEDSFVLDRYDLDGRYSGPCPTCNEDTYDDVEHFCNPSDLYDPTDERFGRWANGE